MNARLINKLLAPIAGARMRQIGANLGWLLFEKLLRYGLALIVGFWLARSIGKEGFGILNSATAFVTLFTALYTLGMDSVVVQKLTQTPNHRRHILGTAFILRMAGSFATALICIIYHYFRSDPSFFYIILVTTLMPVLQTFEVPDFYFQSETRSKMTVKGKMFGLITVLGLRVVFIVMKAPLIWFAWANIAEFMAAALALMYIYQKDVGDLRHWQFDLNIAKELIKQSWPLALSMLGTFIYFNMGQIQVSEMLGEAAAGLYAAGIKFSVFWYFIPTMVFVSVFPHFLKLKDENEALFHKRLRQLFGAMFWGAVLLCLGIYFSADLLISVCFGPGYTGASEVLVRHIWAVIFVFLAGSSQIWYLTNQKTEYIIINNLVIAVCNVIFNIVFISSLGVTGAAWSCVLSYGLGHIGIPALFAKTRSLSKDLLLGLNPMIWFRQ